MGKNIFKYPLLYVQNVQLTQSQKECVIPNKKSNLSCKREMNENLILMGNYHLEEKKMLEEILEISEKRKWAYLFSFTLLLNYCK